LCHKRRQHQRIKPRHRSIDCAGIGVVLSQNHPVVFIEFSSQQLFGSFATAIFNMRSLLGDGIVASAFGILVHYGLFIKGEWHLQAPTILACHVLIFPTILSLEVLGGGKEIHQACLRSFVISTMYIASLLLSIATYRIFFHRLGNFSGPRLAALSKLWHVWKCRNSRGHLVLDDWHKKYGTFVRTGACCPVCFLHR
jgi:hypothetical protein